MLSYTQQPSFVGLGQAILHNFPTTINPQLPSGTPVTTDMLNAEVQAFQLFLDDKLVQERQRNYLLIGATALISVLGSIALTKAL